MPDQSTLKQFLQRRHPDFVEKLDHWRFCLASYEGGRDWFRRNIHRYVKEGDDEFDARLLRAFRFNHTREVVDLIQKYIFKSGVERNLEDATADVRAFWTVATLSGLSIDEFMKLVGVAASIFGRVWVFVDSTKSEAIQTQADAKEAGTRCYAYIVRPMDVLDVGVNDDGSLSWVLVRERVRDDKDPIGSSGAVTERYRLWTTKEWTLWRIVRTVRGKPQDITVEELCRLDKTAAQSVQIIEEDSGEVDLGGQLPCFPHDHVIGDHRYSAPGLIDDTAYLDKAVANYLSNLDAIIQDQTFSQLVMPAEGVLAGEDKYETLKKMGTKRIFIYDGESPTAPSYISPDPKQASMIVTVINKIINEIYHTIGMGGERTKQDNAVGIDNSSGVAKAYDFERLNSLLVSKSQSLENTEYKIIELVGLWNDRKPNRPADDADAPVLVKYADTFDVRSLFDEFTIAEKLMLMGAPDTVRQQQMKLVVDKLFPALSQDLKQAMLDDIEDNWPPEPPEETVTTTATDGTATAKATGGPAAGSGAKTPAKKNAGTKSRRGQVTSETK